MKALAAVTVTVLCCILAATPSEAIVGCVPTIRETDCLGRQVLITTLDELINDPNFCDDCGNQLVIYYRRCTGDENNVSTLQESKLALTITAEITPLLACYQIEYGAIVILYDLAIKL